MDGVVDPWIEGLWPALSNVYASVNAREVHICESCTVPPLVATQSAAPAPAPSPVQSQPPLEDFKQSTPCAESPFFAPVVSARLLTKPNYEDKRIFEIELDLADYPELKYHPGDCIAIFAHNPPAEVQRLMDRLGFEDGALSLSGDNLPPNVLSAKSARDVLTRFVDVTSMPRKTFLKALATCCSNEDEQLRLNHLASADAAGRSAYNEYIAQRPSLLDILTDFPSAHPSLDMLVQQLPPLQPRSYSVVSAPIISPTRVRVAFSVAQYKARNEIRNGLCTSWLAEQCAVVLQGSPCPRVSLFLRPSNDFRLPSDQVPLLLIGAGTGISPFVSFVQQRQALRRGGSELAEMWVFFGCRHADADFIYQEELTTAAESGVITKLVTAFSRDQSEKQYVTHKMTEHGDEVARLLLQENATVFVCGDAKGVVKSVRETFVGILQQHGGMDAKQAQQKLLEMTKSKRYVLDIWG